MKLAIIITTKNFEIAWNAFRLAIEGRKQKHEVKVFLMGEGVECEGLNFERFNIDEEIQQFISLGGKLKVCGTCLNARHLDSSDFALVSTLVGCLDMIEWADKVLTF